MEDGIDVLESSTYHLVSTRTRTIDRLVPARLSAFIFIFQQHFNLSKAEITAIITPPSYSLFKISASMTLYVELISIPPTAESYVEKFVEG